MRSGRARVSDASGIPITCRLDAVDRELSTDTALRLFRVAQEGLNNVVKHSGATNASLDLTLEPAHVRLAIQDNGKGFDPGEISPTRHHDFCQCASGHCTHRAARRGPLTRWPPRPSETPRL